MEQAYHSQVWHQHLNGALGDNEEVHSVVAAELELNSRHRDDGEGQDYQYRRHQRHPGKQRHPHPAHARRTHVDDGDDEDGHDEEADEEEEEEEVECDESCSICDGPSSSECSACNLGWYYDSGACFPCVEGCSECDDSVSCNVCVEGYFIEE